MHRELPGPGIIRRVRPSRPAPTMANLPTGTVALLFTDVEGSTRLWETNAAAMRAALARHDALIRHCIDDREWHVFKTRVESVCVSCHSARAAGASSLG